ncbi:HEAT repeat domain-containing protein [Fimbriiglobus ruber]|uniref:HEAT repeat protein n=1 Tax=Fimbriiglobus ruber TaxID=1908690 RepID=A0A225DBZ2_9BACT|nr:hypothetical protein [Fimbriiglobus ruber]OWK38513.1 hypothetical protein FRUB_07633 [Fimbriiglobus ruber]
MAREGGRAYVKWVGGLAAVVLVAGGGFLATGGVGARYAGYQFRTASTDEERAAAAARLVAMGEAGAPYFTEPFRAGDPAGCAAVAAAVKDYLAPLPPDDPKYAACCRFLLTGSPAFADAGRGALLDLIPALVKTPDPSDVERCRAAVRAGLAGATPDDKVRAVRLALRPEIGLTADTASLLNDADAEVRRAAMLAVGPVPDGQTAVVKDEDLFRWLHDPDAEVRNLCETALLARGLDHEHVALARLLSDPEPAGRLNLLVELRAGGPGIKDPGPWLERLGQDPDPAVRLGAARVAFESRLVFAGWLDRLAADDPNPTVRRWAGYYSSRAAAVKQAGFRQE